MSMMGADLAQMTQLESQYRAAGSTVVDLQAQVDRALGSTQWTGPAADRFREAWNAEFRTALQRLRDALEENAHIVANRRQAIETATH